VIKAIVNIASTSWAPPDSALHPHYAAATGGHRRVHPVRRAAAGPLRRDGERAGPGATRRSADVAFEGGEVTAADVPLGRINKPADIAAAVAYLVFPDARNVSGQLLTVAGGLNPAL
jgi:3-oxoacyl-[acyl-carrier protein] reductase